MSSERFHVGQVVMLHRRGRREANEATVTKVGRKLVYVEQYGRPVAFRMDSGSSNDDYGHQWIETLEMQEQRERRDAALAVLREHKLRTDFGFSLPLETIERIGEILVAGNPDKDGEK